MARQRGHGPAALRGRGPPGIHRGLVNAYLRPHSSGGSLVEFLDAGWLAIVEGCPMWVRTRAIPGVLVDNRRAIDGHRLPA